MNRRNAVVILVVLMLSLAAAAVFRPGERYANHDNRNHRDSQNGEKNQIADEFLLHPPSWTPATWFSFGQVVIGGAQAVLFWWQLGLMRDSAKEAAIAANAAMKSADTAERALTNLERPYLFVSIEMQATEAGRMPVDGSPGAGNDHPIAVTIHNYGKGPAVMRRLRAYSVVDVVPPQELIEHPDSQTLIPDGLAIAPDKPLSQTILCRLTTDQWIDVQNRNKQIYCCGLVDYADVIGGNRTTGFCWQLNWRDAEREFSICPGTPLNHRT